MVSKPLVRTDGGELNISTTWLRPGKTVQCMSDDGIKNFIEGRYGAYIAVCAGYIAALGNTSKLKFAPVIDATPDTEEG